MYNIWKHSVVQRQNDEVLLTIVFSIALVFQTLVLNDNFSVSFGLDQMYLGGRDIFGNYEIVDQLSAEKKAEYCRLTLLTAAEHSAAIDQLVLLVAVYSVGMLTSFVQKIIVVRVRNNATMNIGVLFIQLAGGILGVLLWIASTYAVVNNSYSTMCQRYQSMTEDEIYQLDRVKCIINSTKLEGTLPFKYLLSLIIVQICLNSINILQRTNMLGESIIMLFNVLFQLAQFFVIILMVIGIYLAIGRFNF